MIVATLLIVHGLMAVALLGAVTHQAIAVARRAPSAASGFLQRYGGVDASAYGGTIVLLFLCTAGMGAVLYPSYRLDVRPVLEIYNLRAANGVFEIKEHFAGIGLMLLPAYWALWRKPLLPEHAVARMGVTCLLALFVWWNFIVGHVLNNIRGLG